MCEVTQSELKQLEWRSQGRQAPRRSQGTTIECSWGEGEIRDMNEWTKRFGGVQVVLILGTSDLAEEDNIKIGMVSCIIRQA